jgi:DNA-directed RNA polymerase subunit RPC12/RpoP
MTPETKIESVETVQMAFGCPHCHRLVQAIFPQRFDEGEKVRCPSCFGVFVIPAQEAAA